MDFYHAGMRALQDRYEGRGVADRIAQHRRHGEFSPAERALIESTRFFFLATAAGGCVDCSFKGGEPGFVRVTGPSELTYPDYDGNRMYRSLGNIAESPQVGLLFMPIDGTRFDGMAGRLRVSGRAEIDERPEARAGWVGAKRLVRVRAEHIYTNCPRYIPALQLVEPSVYAPRPGHTPPEPEWKSRDYIRDVLERERR
ncbi:MAG: pyridoxamine 5'-phosphate oxidase family protein [Alphaproteobacteria bacterium]|nr:pyridoxamine 5'-phosphate oxidase family protein [Alphaproteobacteria bacterium]